MVLCVLETPPSLPRCEQYCAGSISTAGRGCDAGLVEVGEGQTAWLTIRHMKL